MEVDVAGMGWGRGVAVEVNEARATGASITGQSGVIARGTRRGVSRRLVGVLLATFCLCFAYACAPALAGTTYVDGVSDQNLPYWDGNFSGSYFANFFHNTWVGSPPSHIKLARLVVPWDVMHSEGSEYQRLAAWYGDMAGIGLTPEIAISYGISLGHLPPSSSEYRTWVERILNRFSIGYLEAWNEPNHSGGPSEADCSSFRE